MNWPPRAAEWRQLAATLERRWRKVIDRQLTLWAGTRDRTQQLAESRARQEESERPK